MPHQDRPTRYPASDPTEPVDVFVDPTDTEPAPEPEPTVKVALHTNRGTFAKGHAKMGGRVKGSPTKPRVWQAREIVDREDFHPLEEAIHVIRTGYWPGKVPTAAQLAATPAKFKPISDEERLKMLREIFKYVFPSLSAMQVTGRDGGPLAAATLDVTALMRDPAMLEAAQKLSLGMVTGKPTSTPTDTQKLLPQSDD